MQLTQIEDDIAEAGDLDLDELYKQVVEYIDQNSQGGETIDMQRITNAEIEALLT